MHWIPLESNPEVMNQFIQNLGIKDGWKFVDVYALDTEVLNTIPKPVLAVVLLYPLTDAVNSKPIGKEVDTNDVLFIKQTIGNACGTVALLHSILNNQDVLEFKDRSLIDDLLNKLRSLKPAERGVLMEQEERLSVLHEKSATEGQTVAPAPTECTNLHFISFVHRKGNLYELDGRKESPVCHGHTNSQRLLEDTCTVIKKFMERDPNDMNFTVVALCKET